LYGQKGIYFFHYPKTHIYGEGIYAIETSHQFDKNGDFLIIKIDRPNDELSFIDKKNVVWKISLSKVTENKPFVFSFMMYRPEVKISVRFY
jgi:hypothetical protein